MPGHRGPSARKLTAGRRFPGTGRDLQRRSQAVGAFTVRRGELDDSESGWTEPDGDNGVTADEISGAVVDVLSGTRWRDAVATVLVGAFLIIYAAATAGIAVPLIADNGDLAAVGLFLGFSACLVGGWGSLSARWRRVWTSLSGVALTLAIVTMATESVWWLAGFVGCVVLLWLGTTIGHLRAIILDHRRPTRGAAPV